MEGSVKRGWGEANLLEPLVLLRRATRKPVLGVAFHEVYLRCP